MKYLRIKDWPIDYAQKAYNKKNYIEAMQVLHGFIETKLQELLILTGMVDFNRDASEIWDIANQISYINCVKVLYVLGQISRKEYQDAIQFNKMRNQLVHKIFHDPYDQGFKGIPSEEFAIVFKQGLELGDLLQRKTEEKIE